MLSEIELGNTPLDIWQVKLRTLNDENSSRILHLAFRGTHFHPFQLREKYILRLCDYQPEASELNLLTSLKLCRTESAILPDDEINFPSIRKIDDVELITRRQSIFGRLQLCEVPEALHELNERA